MTQDFVDAARQTVGLRDPGAKIVDVVYIVRGDFRTAHRRLVEVAFRPGDIDWVALIIDLYIASLQPDAFIVDWTLGGAVVETRVGLVLREKRTHIR